MLKPHALNTPVCLEWRKQWPFAVKNVFAGSRTHHIGVLNGG